MSHDSRIDSTVTEAATSRCGMKGAANDAHHLDFGADRRPPVPQASPSGRDRRGHQEGSGGMMLILLQAIIQSIASTLYWIGLYVGIRALPGEKPRRLPWTLASAAVLVVWLVGVMLLAA